MLSIRRRVSVDGTAFRRVAHKYLLRRFDGETVSSLHRTNYGDPWKAPKDGKQLWSVPRALRK